MDAFPELGAQQMVPGRLPLGHAALRADRTGFAGVQVNGIDTEALPAQRQERIPAAGIVLLQIQPLPHGIVYVFDAEYGCLVVLAVIESGYDLNQVPAEFFILQAAVDAGQHGLA